ncbi:TonB family C-terminal domain-containing protein [Bacteroidales bacterium KHT7]|nr:TonB family C-terminal domain-containing protein [Bacteroidales bacterium KHT7]
MKKLLLLLILAAFSVTMVHAQNEDSDSCIYCGNCDNPEYPGGIKALLEDIDDNLKYPKKAIKKNISGKVIIQCVISKDGALSDVNVIRKVHPLLDAEAVRVVSSLHKRWKPGTQCGKAAAVIYTIPVLFRLKDGKPVRLFSSKKNNKK